MKKIALGIIGTGIAAKKLHLPALRALTDKFEITAVCNHTEPKAKEFSKLVGDVPFYLDYTELLNRDDIEAVDIILPIPMNYRATKDALEAGKHVILEKPLAANLKEARKMLAFPRRYRQVMMVAENYRYQSLYRHAAELIGNHAIGKPYAAVWNIFHRITEDNPYAATAWRIKHRYPGGFLTDGGVHNMAVLRSLVGDITSVSGFASQVNPAIGKLDTLSFDFKSERDVRGTFTLFVSAVGYEKNQLLVFGTDGTMIVEDGTVTLRRPGKSDVVDVLKEDDGFTEEFLDFFNAIRTGTKVRGTFLEAYRDLRVILTALESAQSGKRKKLPTKP